MTTEKQEQFIGNICNQKVKPMNATSAALWDATAEIYESKAANPADSDDPKWSARRAARCRKISKRKAKGLRNSIRDKMKDHIKGLQEQNEPDSEKIADAKERLADWLEKH